LRVAYGGQSSSEITLIRGDAPARRIVSVVLTDVTMFSHGGGVNRGVCDLQTLSSIFVRRGKFAERRRFATSWGMTIRHPPVDDFPDRSGANVR
jgi:hypothetical protein